MAVEIMWRDLEVVGTRPRGQKVQYVVDLH